MSTEATPPAELPVAFEPGPSSEVAVIQSEKALALQRRKARIADAAAYEKLGLRLLKFKARKLGEAGDYIVNVLNVKKVGHGTIISATEDADESIRQCDALVKEFMAKDPPCDPDVVVAVMGLKRDFIQQVLDSGEAHLRIDRQPNVAPEGHKFSMPFPSGTSMTIAVNQPQSHQPSQLLPPVEPTVPEA